MRTREQKRPPSHPGKIIKGLYLEPFSITISKIAETLGVSRNTVSRIIKEQSSVTPEMALRLSRAFNTGPELWLNLQKKYDLWYAARRSDDWQKVQPMPMSPDSRIKGLA